MTNKEKLLVVLVLELCHHVIIIKNYISPTTPFLAALFSRAEIKIVQK
jgi:hypothetical protein